MKYQECAKCVMDTTDQEITFNEAGICNHCLNFELVTKKSWFPDKNGVELLEKKLIEIKRSGRGKNYDCILGLSGGVDSSYLAIKASEWGLKPLIIHVDAGWNSEIAVGNIEKIVKYCNYDLHTIVVDWEEMRDLQLAYLKSGVANQDVPQDHIFFASLYHYATQNRIRYILSGGNIATESIFPNSWHGSAMDAINLRAIHKEFGEHPLKGYKTISFFESYIWYPLAKKMRMVMPLNYMPYNKEIALIELQNKIGYTPYDRKHGESLFTKLFQNYYLPAKFGYDKRRPHLSSLIVSGQMHRDAAKAELLKPLYQADELENDLNYFCKKLRIDRADFDLYMSTPTRHYSEFKNWDSRYKLVKRIQKVVEKILGWNLKIYS